MNQPIPVVTFVERLRLRRQETRVDFLLTVPRRHGPIARMSLWGGLVQSQLVTDPAIAHAVLVEQSDAFMKGLALSYFMKPMLGDGLLSSEGAFHRKQRRMLAPSFMPKRLADYATTIADRSEAAQRTLRDGASVDVNTLMMRLTLEIVGATLFGAEVGAEAEEVHGALTDAMAQMSRMVRSVIPIPPTWPTPGNRRGLRAVARLDRIIYGLIEERRRAGGERHDFLSMLLAARDEAGGAMTDKQVRDEAMTIFLAGHETTANALTWTFYLLAKHPAVRDRLERELDAHLGGRTPTLADLAKLPYAMMVFKEAMRLYPPAYVIARRALRDVDIEGRHIPKGNLVVINIIGMHHDPVLFPDPERFDPERFTPEAEKALPKNAFLPFGAGPRVCIGNHFALMEGHLALATLAQRVRFELPPSAPPAEMEPLVTLRPRGGMPMTAHRRAIEGVTARPLCALVFVLGCVTARRAPQQPSPVEASTDAGAPVVVDVYTPPSAPAPVVPSRPPSDAQALQGSVVFMRVCGPCHLAMWQVPSGGSLSAANRSEAAVRRQIREGSGRAPDGMPAIGVDRLPESEMPALMAYLRQLHVVGPR